jgi:putative transposase
VIGLYKAEVIYRLGPWCNAEYVEFESRPLMGGLVYQPAAIEPIGNIPPTE